MSVRLGLGSAVLLALVACGGTKSETTVNTATPEALKSSPAGVASMVFLDLESVRPDALPSYTVTPGGALGLVKGSAPLGGTCATPNTVTSGTTVTTTITYVNCTGANGNILNGTVTITHDLSAPMPQEHQVLYALNASNAPHTQTWTYSGIRLVTIDQNASTAHVGVPTGTSITVTFTDTTNSQNNKVYSYVPDLYFSWGPNQLNMWGGYSFTQGATVVSASVAQSAPLTWTQGCCYPLSGAITLATGSAHADAVFGPNCGNLTINGGHLDLAACN